MDVSVKGEGRRRRAGVLLKRSVFVLTFIPDLMKWIDILKYVP
jgi:hypothetical protein